MKERGDISEGELASDFCSQLPSWCPCLNCRDFEPHRLVITKSDKEMLKTKRKAPQNSVESRKESRSNSSLEVSSEASTTEEQHADVERFQFDCNIDELQKFKEGECPGNTAKSNDWALQNFHAWRVARNEKLIPG